MVGKMRRTVDQLRHLNQLQSQVDSLTAEVAELRRHNLRLAELVDVVQELLIPLSSRDEDAVRDAIDKFNRSL